VPVRRERLETPDGDELWIDHVDGPPGSPRLLILHGLEGSSFSVYAQGLLSAARERGWRASALNFRSCARQLADRSRWIPNLRPRLYHSGETGDLGFVVAHLAATESSGTLFAVGASLGGNVLLKWLGENPSQTAIAAAGTISVPYDLGAGGRHMESGFGPRYVSHLLRTLRVKAAGLARRFPEAAARLDVPRLERARTFFEFDDAATAPLHGFAGAEDYYRRSSSIGFVGRIATPTLAISAQDDPFLPRHVLEEVRRQASPVMDLRFTPRGGHVGFVAGGGSHPRSWAEETILEWLSGRLRDR
jgi:predicted alpha/beta-fold hydrolase